MLKFIVALLLAFTTTNAFAQNDTVQCEEYNHVRALNDIKHRRAQLVIRGGIVAMHYPQDSVFMRKYHVRFNDPGCVLPEDEACIIAYNQTVFQHLDKKYGYKWRKLVRKDLVGYEEVDPMAKFREKLANERGEKTPKKPATTPK